MTGRGEKRPRPAKVKNKNPNEIQITAEQILREAKERQESVPRPPKQRIADAEELADYRGRKRKMFEDSIRRNRHNMAIWLKYATWEESQSDLARARSVLERAIDVDHRHVPTWVRYAEMEMKNKMVNHARNVWDRAVTILPRVAQFWYKYAYMEEMLGNVPGARQVFERWMHWEPDEDAWTAYIKLEKRYGELGRARNVFSRFVRVHPEPTNWIKWARFEEDQHQIEKCRHVYEEAVRFLGNDHIDAAILVSFAKFESRRSELERARAIYKFAIENLPSDQRQRVYNTYTQFEKQTGEREGIEEAVLAKRRLLYADETRKSPTHYDAWFDWIRLEERSGMETCDWAKVRDVYDRAVANIPVTAVKRLWQRYVFLWIKYAVFEELHAQDIDRARKVYERVLSVIPHHQFTFSKVWLMYAQFELRQLDLPKARKILGRAIGDSPKQKLFRSYIELELSLREFDRMRILYAKNIEFSPENALVWVRFAQLEMELGDDVRARRLLDLAIEQELDMPEIAWKAYIDFEIERGEVDRARSLYERLLLKSDHVKVWVSYAKFELLLAPDDDSSLEAKSAAVRRARGLFQKGYDSLKERNAKEERLILVTSWRDFESQHGDAESLASVNALMPSIVKRRRQVEMGDHPDHENQGGGGTMMEEYYDYVFPDDVRQKPNFKLLAMAHKWKMEQEKMKRLKLRPAEGQILGGG